MKKTFAVTYTYGATKIVEANNEEEAMDIVENMTDEELFAEAKSGFDISSTEEIDG